ncbi:MAG: alpha/beta hydrolase fold domain-containing protein [Pseudomonadales bacterium]|nr:alpha/beta hydrolase fold domain-containing protein [Pseudomonadales bacterium]
MRIAIISFVLSSSLQIFAADSHIDFPTVENNVDFEQVQSLPFRDEDHQLAYGADPLQYGKLYLPSDSSSPHPLVVFIHGGCWLNSFDMSHTYPFLTGLVQAGFAVWSLEYRRTGDTGGGWPGTYNDIKSGIGFLPSLASYSVDVNNFVIAGHSAGGHRDSCSKRSNRHRANHQHHKLQSGLKLVPGCSVSIHGLSV